MLIYQPKH